MGAALLQSALGVSVTAALLVGCSVAQPPIGAPDTMPRTRSIALSLDRNGSWMLPEAKSEDLLYVTGPHPPNSKVFVFSYPAGKLVGVLRHFGLPLTECADAHGNVFITDGDAVIEYAHGGKKPINKLSYSGYMAAGCSSDPTSDNLAVAYEIGSSGVVLVFSHASGTPKVYQTQNFEPIWCGYDKAGDLYVDGYQYSPFGFKFVRLRNGGSSFEPITLNETFGNPGPVLWDGKYITVGDNGASIIYRFVIAGSKGTSVGSTTLTPNDSSEWWIQGGRVVGASALFTNQVVYYWKYPAGGSPTKTIAKGLRNPFGAVVSVPPKLLNRLRRRAGAAQRLAAAGS